MTPLSSAWRLHLKTTEVNSCWSPPRKKKELVAVNQFKPQPLLSTPYECNAGQNHFGKPPV